MGAGLFGLSSLLQRDAFAEDRTNPLAPRPQHFPAKAKNIIVLFMVGGPSQVDTFDPKPELVKRNNQPIPESFGLEGISLQFMRATDGNLMASPVPVLEAWRIGNRGFQLVSALGTACG